jgi:hypothetical protein
MKHSRIFDIKITTPAEDSRREIFERAEPLW